MDKTAETEKGGLKDAPSLEEISRKSIHWDEGVLSCQVSSPVRIRATSMQLYTSKSTSEQECCVTQYFHSLPTFLSDRHERPMPCAANLEENEKIKAELAPTKINEPKTPFHAPYSEDEDVRVDTDIEEGTHGL